jgi:hypothetical protein
MGTYLKSFPPGTEPLPCIALHFSSGLADRCSVVSWYHRHEPKRRLEDEFEEEDEFDYDYAGDSDELEEPSEDEGHQEEEELEEEEDPKAVYEALPESK